MHIPEVTHNQLCRAATVRGDVGYQDCHGNFLVQRNEQGTWQLADRLDRVDEQNGGLWRDSSVTHFSPWRMRTVVDRPIDGIIQADEVTPLLEQRHTEVGLWGSVSFYNVDRARVVPDHRGNPVLQQHWSSFHHPVLA